MGADREYEETERKKTCLLNDISKRAKHGDASLDPLGVGILGRQLDELHKVGRVPGRRQRARARQRLVHGAIVESARRLGLAVLLGLEPDLRDNENDTGKQGLKETKQRARVDSA